MLQENKSTKKTNSPVKKIFNLPVKVTNPESVFILLSQVFIGPYHP